jgi:hypothetical protein
MKYSIRILVATLLLALAGCASTDKSGQPDWVAGDSAKYKNEQYLTGRGQGPSQDQARDQARADLSKIFQVAVSASSEDVQQFKTGKEGGQYEGSASRIVSTRTEQVVSGIQIAEVWQDPASHAFHALAVLPRLQTAATLRQQISQLDEATGNYITQSRNSSDLLLKVAAASHALQSQQERDALQKSLQIVDITGRGVAAQWNAARLKADLEVLLKRVHISVRMTEDSSPGAEEIVSGALAYAGFLPEKGTQSDFVLQAHMNLNEVSAREGWYWQRGTVEVTLTEAASGRVRGSKRWSIKASATDSATAVKRALGQADTLLKNELGPAIIGMATGDAPAR